MTCDVVENAEATEEEALGDESNNGDKRRDDALPYPPPIHARCLAAPNMFFSTCAIDSDRCSGVDVVETSVLWWTGNWIVGTTCCSNRAKKRPASSPVNKERADKKVIT
jgi:hypothetical protein